LSISSCFFPCPHFLISFSREQAADSEGCFSV
jgi:hypothetical protein